MPLVNVSTVAIVDGMLPAATFHILLALADEDRHGYAIIQDIAARTDGELKLSAGTLYRSIQRMLEQGLIVETRERPAPEDDDRRRRRPRRAGSASSCAWHGPPVSHPERFEHVRSHGVEDLSAAVARVSGVV